MFESLLSGATLSLGLTCLSLVIGLFLALIMTYVLNSNYNSLKFLTQGFIFFTRGVPLLVQFFLLYYGSAQFEWVRNSLLWEILQHPFACALIALALNSSAYTTVLLQSSICNIPKGEIEACIALHMPLYTRLRQVILPRAFSTFWPAYSNEAIMVLKSTSLASTITLMDLMGATRQIIAKTYEPAEALIMAGCLYLLMSGLLMGIFHTLRYYFNNKNNKPIFSLPQKLHNEFGHT